MPSSRNLTSQIRLLTLFAKFKVLAKISEFTVCQHGRLKKVDVHMRSVPKSHVLVHMFGL